MSQHHVEQMHDRAMKLGDQLQQLKGGERDERFIKLADKWIELRRPGWQNLAAIREREKREELEAEVGMLRTRVQELEAVAA